MNTWHKFTEELPPKDGRYLTVTNANPNPVMELSWTTSEVRGKKVTRWKRWGKLSPWEVTYWMELSEPPSDCM